MKANINIDLWLSRIGLGLIFCYCLLASIFIFDFVKIHLTLHFLPFPIFISEILLFICLVLFVAISKNAELFSRDSVILLSIYFGWVLIKALINLHFDGPLTVRNAALFYYPAFAVFTYCFYPRAEIPKGVLNFLALIIAGVLFFQAMVLHYWWTYVLLLVIAIWNAKSRLRWVGWISLTIILSLGFEYFYQGSRSHSVSILGSVSFLSIYFGAILLKRKQSASLGVLAVAFIVFISGFFIFSNRNSISSLTSFKGMMDTYKAFDHDYGSKEASFVSKPIAVQLYNPNTPEPQPLTGNAGAGSKMCPISSGSGLKHQLNVMSNGFFYRCIDEERPLGIDENNIIFRLVVWRDMTQELIEKKAWWGFSFGHPQRSKFLEVSHWAESEWGRDGWITPHNSFLHVIYRAGILGFCMLGVFFFMIGTLVRDFFRMGSVEGGLLVGALVYWLILSNFLVILEFPYNAILFWSLFGITMAYRDRLKV